MEWSAWKLQDCRILHQTPQCESRNPFLEIPAYGSDKYMFIHGYVIQYSNEDTNRYRLNSHEDIWAGLGRHWTGLLNIYPARLVYLTSRISNLTRNYAILLHVRRKCKWS